ncbi:hypothetical protein REPUB_Repub17cG0053800 [Reevesia pubescens]
MITIAKCHKCKPYLLKYKESTGKSFAEYDNLKMKSKSLEETCSSQREQIRLLELHLAAANEKLKMIDLSASETRMEYLEQKRIIQVLQDRLADMEHKLIEGENLRKKLHNTILVLLLHLPLFVACGAAEGVVVSYPTSMESLGRGIDLIQSGTEWGGGNWEIKTPANLNSIPQWELTAEVMPYMKNDDGAIPSIITYHIDVYLGSIKGRGNIIEVREGMPQP